MIKGCIDLIGKVADFNEEVDGKIIANIVFATILMISLLSLYAESLWSLTINLIFNHHLEIDAKPIVEQVKEEDGIEMECVVCLYQISCGEIYQKLPKCNHSFHSQCIKPWLESHSTCPLCRTPVTTLLSSSPPPHHHQHQHGVCDGFYSGFARIGKWVKNMLRSELTSAHCEIYPNYLL